MSWRDVSIAAKRTFLSVKVIHVMVAQGKAFYFTYSVCFLGSICCREAHWIVFLAGGMSHMRHAEVVLFPSRLLHSLTAAGGSAEIYSVQRLRP